MNTRKHVAGRRIGALMLAFCLTFLGVMGYAAFETRSAKAGTFPDEETGFTWYYTEVDGTITNVYTTDNMTGTTMLKMPSEIDGMPVVSVGGGTSDTPVAPNGYSSIILPNDLETINPYAFYNISSVTTIGGAKNNKLTAIGDYAFAGCTSLDSIKRDDVIAIGAHAFEGCAALKNAKTPEITVVGDNAFKGCTAFTGMDLLNANSIGANAFEGCTAMTYANLGPNMQTIGENAFKDCTSLTKIYVADTVTSIGAGAFTNCTGLTTVQLDSNIDYSGAFVNCTGLTDIVFGEKVEQVAADAFTVPENYVKYSDSLVTSGAINYYFKNNATKVYLKETAGDNKQYQCAYNASYSYDTVAGLYSSIYSSINGKSASAYILYRMNKTQLNFLTNYGYCSVPSDFRYNINGSATVSLYSRQGNYIGYTTSTFAATYEEGESGTRSGTNSVNVSDSYGSFNWTITLSAPFDYEDALIKTESFYAAIDNKIPSVINFYYDRSQKTPADGDGTYVIPNSIGYNKELLTALSNQGETEVNIADISTVAVPTVADPDAKVITKIDASYDGVVAVGQNLDKASVKLTLTYNDYSTATITGADAGVTYDTTKVTVKGDNAVTVTYEGFSDTFNVIGIAGKALQATLNTTYLDALGGAYPDWNVSKQAFKQGAVVSGAMFTVAVVEDDGSGTPTETPTTDFSFKTDTVSAIGDNEIVIVSDNDKSLKATVTVTGYNEDLEDAKAEVEAGTLSELKNNILALKDRYHIAVASCGALETERDTAVASYSAIQADLTDMTEQYNGLVKKLADVVSSGAIEKDDYTYHDNETGKDYVMIGDEDIAYDASTATDLTANEKPVTIYRTEDGRWFYVGDDGVHLVDVDANDSPTQITDDTNAESDQIAITVRKLTAQLQQMNQQLQMLTNKMSVLEEKLGLSGEGNYEDRMDAIIENVDTLNASLAQYKDAISKIYKKLTSEELTDEEIKDLQATLNKILKKIQDAEDSNKDLQETVSGQAITIEGLENDLEDLKAETGELQGTVSSQAITIQNMNGRIDNLTTENEELDRQIKKLEDSVASMSAINVEQESNIRKLNETLTSKDAEIAQGTATIEQLSAVIEQAKEDYAKLSSKNEEQKQQIASMSTTISELSGIRDSQREQITGLQSDLADLQSQNDSMQESINNLNATISSQTSEIASLKAALEQQKAIIEQMKAESGQYLMTIDEAITLFNLKKGATKQEVMEAINSFIAAKATIANIQSAFSTDKEGDELVAYLTEMQSTGSQGTGNSGQGTGNETINTSSANYKSGYEAGKTAGYTEGYSAGKTAGAASAGSSGTSSAQTTINALAAQTSTLSTKNAELVKQNETLTSENETLNTQVTTLSDGIEDLYDAIPAGSVAGFRSVSSVDMSNVTNKLNKVKTYYSKLGQNYETAVEKADTLQEKNESLTTKNASLTKKVNTLTKKNETLTATNKKLKTENQSLNSANTSLKAQVNAKQNTTSQVTGNSVQGTGTSSSSSGGNAIYSQNTESKDTSKTDTEVSKAQSGKEEVKKEKESDTASNTASTANTSLPNSSEQTAQTMQENISDRIDHTAPLYDNKPSNTTGIEVSSNSAIDLTGGQTRDDQTPVDEETETNGSLQSLLVKLLPILGVVLIALIVLLVILKKKSAKHDDEY